MTTTETPRVWIGCLASYNAGRLIGEWVDAVDVDEMQECWERVKVVAVTAAKAEGEYPVYFGEPEEPFIADYDGFGSIASSLGEYPSWAEVAKVGEAIEEHGGAFIAWYENESRDDADSLAENFAEEYKGTWSSEEAYAGDYVEGCGAFPNGAAYTEGIDSFVDWSSVWDWLRDGGCWSQYAGGGDYWIFGP
jgi:antirestriction protein